MQIFVLFFRLLLFFLLRIFDFPLEKAKKAVYERNFDGLCLCMSKK